MLEGERAHRPLPPSTRPAAYGVPERPKGMTAQARRAWDAYIEQLAPLGFLRPVDAFALQRLCEDVALLHELQAGMRQVAAERDRPERERRKRLKAIQEELKQLAGVEGEGAQVQTASLQREAAQLAADRPEAPSLIALTMSHEGRRLSGTINALASRICRQEMQFGLTPVSSQRIEGAAGAGAMMPAQSQVESIEQALCG